MDSTLICESNLESQKYLSSTKMSTTPKLTGSFYSLPSYTVSTYLQKFSLPSHTSPISYYLMNLLKIQYLKSLLILMKDTTNS